MREPISEPAKPVELSPQERALLEQLAELAMARLTSYFKPDGTIDTEANAIVKQTQHLDQSELAVSSRRKRRSEERRNEDMVALGQDVPGFIVSDGVSGRGENVSALVGEIASLVVPAQLNELEQQQASAAKIEATLRRSPDLIRRLLTHVLARVPEPIQRTIREINPRSFAATLDVVYYARHLARVFSLHIGNGRTYQVTPGRTINHDAVVHKLTTAHESEDNGTLDSCVALDNRSVVNCDIVSERAVVGDHFVTVTDGTFAAYEATRGPQSFLQILEIQDYSQPIDRVVGSIQATEQMQTADTLDDASVGVLRCT